MVDEKCKEKFLGNMDAALTFYTQNDRGKKKKKKKSSKNKSEGESLGKTPPVSNFFILLLYLPPS